jgi:hypothetical protein
MFPRNYKGRTLSMPTIILEAGERKTTEQKKPPDPQNFFLTIDKVMLLRNNL